METLKYLQHIVLGFLLGLILLGVSTLMPRLFTKYIWSFEHFVTIHSLVAPDVSTTDTFQDIKLTRDVHGKGYPLTSNRTLSELIEIDDNGRFIRKEIMAFSKQGYFEANTGQIDDNVMVADNVARIRIELPKLNKGNYIWSFCWDIDVDYGETKTFCKYSNAFKVI